jgi:hypothetical protein
LSDLDHLLSTIPNASISSAASNTSPQSSREATEPAGERGSPTVAPPEAQEGVSAPLQPGPATSLSPPAVGATLVSVGAAPPPRSRPVTSLGAAWVAAVGSTRGINPMLSPVSSPSVPVANASAGCFTVATRRGDSPCPRVGRFVVAFASSPAGGLGSGVLATAPLVCCESAGTVFRSISLAVAALLRTELRLPFCSSPALDVANTDVIGTAAVGPLFPSSAVFSGKLSVSSVAYKAVHCT